MPSRLRSLWHSQASFCLPAMGVLFLVLLYPVLHTVFLAFTDARLANLDHPQGIGLENFLSLLHDPDWIKAIGNTLIFTVASVSIETVLGILFAVLMNSQIVGKGLIRSAVILPWVIPSVIAARIWAWMFNDLYGVVNSILKFLKMGSGQTAWLAEDRWMLGCLVVVDVWKATPFMALLFLAGLQAIPMSLYEAATLDGASQWKQFWKITLPLLIPQLAVAVLFRVLDALRVFDLPFVLTSNSRSTAVVSTYIRQQMVDFQEVGYASAASIFVFCFTVVLAILYLGVIDGGKKGQGRTG